MSVNQAVETKTLREQPRPKGLPKPAMGSTVEEPSHRETPLSPQAQAQSHVRLVNADQNQDIDIGINAVDRQAVAQALSATLADSFTLYLKTHNFHWNVTGPMFNALHNMFEIQYTEQWTALDDIAERIRALGMNTPRPS